LPEFRVAVLLNGTRMAEGKGGSKKEAEKASAKKALSLLKKQEGKNK
jgi:dsRNA-specific ribonuclease